ncbi:hypothetical protein HDU67_003674 [Dinochytrium kinnereticum]|nr:hypothetical protein HDU67_003674 [Dinochytrium kinnereticum]
MESASSCPIAITRTSEEVLAPSLPLKAQGWEACELSAIDRIGRNMFIPLTWFFQRPLDDHLLSALKGGLADALSYLPIFASRIQVLPSGEFIAAGHEGVEWVVATTANRLSDFLPAAGEEEMLGAVEFRRSRSMASTFHPGKAVTIHPWIEKQLPITSIVVVSIPSDGALAISIRIGHVIADANTISALLRRWSSAVKSRLNVETSSEAPPTPILPSLKALLASHADKVTTDDLTSLTFRPIEASWFAPPKEEDGEWQQGETPPDVQIFPAVLKVPVAWVSRLKAAITEKIKQSKDVEPGSFVSSDDCLTAFLWKASASSPHRASGVPCTNHRPTNLRSLLNVPAETPGNLIMNMTTPIASVPETPLHKISLALRNTVINVPWKKELAYLTYHSKNDLWYSSDIVRDGQPDFVISSWSQFNFSALDFGFGAAVDFESESYLGPPNVGQIMLEGDWYKVQLALFGRDMDAFKQTVAAWQHLPSDVL